MDFVKSNNDQLMVYSLSFPVLFAMYKIENFERVIF